MEASPLVGKSTEAELNATLSVSEYFYQRQVEFLLKRILKKILIQFLLQQQNVDVGDSLF